MSSSGPVSAPGPHATFGVMFAESLRSSKRLTRSADTLALRAELRSSLIGSKTSSLLRRSLDVVPWRTSVPEMTQLSQNQGFS